MPLPTSPDPARPTIERLGEDALLLRFGDAIEPACNARVHAAARNLHAARSTWFRDIVPAFASLALFVDRAALPPAPDPLAIVEAWLRAQAFDDAAALPGGRVVEIAVRYGGDHGPDLSAVAAHAGLSPREVVQRHVAGTYTVAMLGFAPGFPYLLGLDPRLAAPRLRTPRTQVAAGSIGIGGAQTGIYPRPGPGGWSIIGRTEAVLFAALRQPPALLAAGDRVRFVAIGALP